MGGERRDDAHGHERHDTAERGEREKRRAPRELRRDPQRQRDARDGRQRERSRNDGGRARAAGGAPLVFYRDEWLRLKLKLWDGNVLRLSAIESIRKKEGFWKRGSRKSKWKPGATTARHQLKISVVVDARTHVIRRPAQQQRLDRLWLEAEVATEDRLVLCAYADDRLNAQHLLGAMKLAYDHVMPRTSAG